MASGARPTIATRSSPRSRARTPPRPTMQSRLSGQLTGSPAAGAAGWVLTLGRAVACGRVGDRVAVQSNRCCGGCEFCRGGDESLCLNGELLGVGRDGGFAEQVCVPSRALVRLPDSVEFT